MSSALPSTYGVHRIFALDAPYLPAIFLRVGVSFQPVDSIVCANARAVD